MLLRIQNKTVRATFALSAVLLLGACDNDNAETSSAQSEVQAISVFSTRVVREEMVKPVVGTGTIAAQKTTDVGPLVDGIIEEVFVRVGDRVSEGDKLFKTRDIEFRLRVQELESQHRLAEAEARNSTRELERIRELYAKGVSSVGQRDNVQTKYDIAQARLGVARARRDAARQNLSDTVVSAPFNGVITAQEIYEGKFMSTRGGGGMGGPSGVVQIMKIDIVGAVVNVPEIFVGQISVGMRARVFVDGINGVYESEVHIFNDKVNPSTRSAEVRIGLPNDDYSIKPGMFTRVELFPPARSVLTLNRTAVLGIAGNNYVFTQSDTGRATRVPVRVTQIDTARVEIVDGLGEGAEVLIGPALSALVAGMPVLIQSSPGEVPLSTAGVR